MPGPAVVSGAVLDEQGFTSWQVQACMRFATGMQCTMPSRGLVACRENAISSKLRFIPLECVSHCAVRVRVRARARVRVRVRVRGVCVCVFVTTRR